MSPYVVGLSRTGPHGGVGHFLGANWPVDAKKKGDENHTEKRRGSIRWGQRRSG